MARQAVEPFGAEPRLVAAPPPASGDDTEAAAADRETLLAMAGGDGAVYKAYGRKIGRGVNSLLNRRLPNKL